MKLKNTEAKTQPGRRRPRVQTPVDGESMTKQAFKEECDINNIVRRYNEGGAITHINSRQPIYGDFSMEMDYQESLNRVHRAQEAFDALPANIRERFDNDPAQAVSFLQNPSNADEARKLGLLPPLPEPAPAPVDASAPAPQKPEKTEK